MIITTETGSRYEIDLAEQKIRRLSGKTPPTKRMDGQDWRPYVQLYPKQPTVGLSMVIVWGDDVELLPETKPLAEAYGKEDIVKMTTTSKVQAIIEN